MPLPRNWVEELIVEWLHLEGYFVEANFPVATALAGGRGEADVVGAKITGNSLDIMHIETGQLTGGQTSINSVEKKYRSEIRDTLIKYFKESFAFKGEKINYEKLYIASYWTQPTIMGIKRMGIEVITLPSFIMKRVIPAMQVWKENPPHAPKARGAGITLPESHWLLKLLEHLWHQNLLIEQ